MNRLPNAVRWVFGFAFGFVASMAFLLGINTLYRGTWLAMALIGVLSLLVTSHPRLAGSRQTAPFLLFFGFLVTAFWMFSVGPSPVRLLMALSTSIPYLLLLLALVPLVSFIGRREASNPSARYAWVPAALFCLFGCLVVFFSGAGGGAGIMVHWLTSHFGWSDDLAHTVVIVVRKSLHFSFYGSVALNAAILARLDENVKPTVAFALLTALSFASFDEFRQSTSVGRTASVWDIGLDMVGAFCFVGILVLSYRRRMQREQVSARLHV